MIIRSVNQHNLKQEFAEIARRLSPDETNRNQTLVPSKPRRMFLSVDTEFPGIVTNPNSAPKRYCYLSRQERYDVMRYSVNKTKLIQLGLAVYDASQGSKVVWEFNFKEFDRDRDEKNSESIDFLKRHGVDIDKNKKEGICCEDFSEELNELLNNARKEDLDLTWVFFHCTYDLGYLVKILTREPLPKKVEDFIQMVKRFLGRQVFDLKEMEEEYQTLGLDKVAEKLKVERIGQSHQAGSDSLLTLDCFVAVFESLESEKKKQDVWKRCRFKLHGFHDDEKKSSDDVLSRKGGDVQPEKLVRKVPPPPMMQPENVMCNNFEVQQQNSFVGLPINPALRELQNHSSFQNSVAGNLQDNPGLQNSFGSTARNSLQYYSGCQNNFGSTMHQMHLSNPSFKNGVQKANSKNSGLKKKPAPPPGAAVDVYSPHYVNQTVKSQ